MNRPVLALQLDPRSTQPLFVQIARAISRDIRRGLLAGGTRLPGSRSLAVTLRVHRNTVLAALSELEQEGWIKSQPRRGTFVVHTLPGDVQPLVGRTREPSARSRGQPAVGPRGPVRLALRDEQFPEPRDPPTENVLRLLGGLPDMRLLRKKDIARAHRRALLSPLNSLDYASAWGHPRLRRALAQFLGETRGIATAMDNVLVTRGSQMSLYLIAQALCGPGSRIAVEDHGYPPAWQALRMAGATLVPLAVDAEGLNVDALQAAHRAAPLTAVYVTPHHQFPTTVTLSARRRQQLLTVARQQQLAIIEDDYDHEQHYAGRPVLPLATQAPDLVLYVGTFSKVLAPGLRVGYTVGPSHVLDRMMQLRTYIDRQGDLPLECALGEMLEEGEVQRHTRRITRHSHERRDALVEALRCEFGSELQFRVPPGGMALWAKASTSTEAWARRALKAGVLVQHGRLFRFDDAPSSFLRLGFGALTPQEIQRAVKLLGKASPSRIGTRS